MTSLGVRIAHDTSSAIDEAAECTMGDGSDDNGVRRVFIDSYVRKKAPAECHVSISEFDMHLGEAIQDGKVARITLPIP
jgi:hypothetical protein